MAPLEYRSGNHMIHKTKSARTQQRKCIMFKNKTLDLINTFSRQTLYLWLVIVICLISLSSVQSQPLHLPAEQFTCDSHTACERWGYTACVVKDGESYCMPCGDDYLKSLCGTKEEVPGCNLYCQQEALTTEKKKMRVEFIEETNAVNFNLSRISRNLHEVQTELELSQNETDKLRRTRTSLGLELDRERSNKESLLIVITMLSAIIFTGMLVCVVLFKLEIIRFYKMHQKKETYNDIDNDLKFTLLDKSKSEKSLSNHSDESGIGKDNLIPDVVNKGTQTNDNCKESIATEQERDKAGQESRCLSDCPGYSKFQNIKPTSPDAENDPPVIAIK